MDLLDVVIVVLVGVAIGSGRRRGLTWVGLSMLGLLVGLIAGTALAAPLARHFGGHSPSSQALIGMGIVLGCIAIVQGIGTAIGYRARAATLGTRLAGLDSGLGALLAAASVLATAWFLGFSLRASSSRTLDQQISRSGILRSLDHLFPRPPGFLNELGQVLKDPSFVHPFDSLAPTDLSPIADVPGDLRTPGIQAAVAATSKVYSEGCGLEAGSAFPIGSDHYATNAHVVAGGQHVVVQLPGGRRMAATVVLYDPQNDVAVLLVPGAGQAALPLAGADPGRGLAGAVIGYPGGAGEQAVPAAVRGLEQAQGNDIYGSSRVVRRVEVLQAQIIPGNSGGPMVDRNGTVVGMVFAASTTDDAEGYALAMSQISGDLSRGQTLGNAVSTQDCTN